jgi:preprotein translocase subunit SecA
MQTRPGSKLWDSKLTFIHRPLNSGSNGNMQESRIIAQAGLPGCITVATNMAGRGTDIILGGQAKGLVGLELEWQVLPLLVKGKVPC